MVRQKVLEVWCEILSEEVAENYAAYSGVLLHHVPETLPRGPRIIWPWSGYTIYS